MEFACCPSLYPDITLALPPTIFLSDTINIFFGRLYNDKFLIDYTSIDSIFLHTVHKNIV